MNSPSRSRLHGPIRPVLSSRFNTAIHHERWRCETHAGLGTSACTRATTDHFVRTGAPHQTARAPITGGLYAGALVVLARLRSFTGATRRGQRFIALGSSVGWRCSTLVPEAHARLCRCLRARRNTLTVLTFEPLSAGRTRHQSLATIHGWAAGHPHTHTNGGSIGCIRAHTLVGDAFFAIVTRATLYRFTTRVRHFAARLAVTGRRSGFANALPLGVALLPGGTAATLYRFTARVRYLAASPSATRRGLGLAIALALRVTRLPSGTCATRRRLATGVRHLAANPNAAGCSRRLAGALTLGVTRLTGRALRTVTRAHARVRARLACRALCAITLARLRGHVARLVGVALGRITGAMVTNTPLIPRTRAALHRRPARRFLDGPTFGIRSGTSSTRCGWRAARSTARTSTRCSDYTHRSR
jgi:hypothetical protein